MAVDWNSTVVGIIAVCSGIAIVAAVFKLFRDALLSNVLAAQLKLAEDMARLEKALQNDLSLVVKRIEKAEELIEKGASKLQATGLELALAKSEMTGLIERFKDMMGSIKGGRS